MSDQPASRAESARPTIAALVRALRKKLELDQTQLGTRCGFAYPQVAISMIEINRNKLTKYEARKQVAAGFYLTVDEFNAYLDGRTDLDRAAELSRSRTAAPPE